MTKGDRDSIKCPACKAVIRDPLGGQSPTASGIIELSAACHVCKAVIHLWARLTVVVEAERESKVK